MKFAILAGAAIALAAPAVLAAPADYRFTVAGQTHQADGTDLVRVHLVHLPDGKQAQGAVVFGPRATMGGGDGAMFAPAKALAPAADGAAVIQVSPSMAGPWTISLSARVNGEPEVIRGTVDVALGK